MKTIFCVILLLFFYIDRVWGMNHIDSLYAEYNRTTSSARIAIANRLYEELYRREHIDTLMQLSGKMERSVADAYMMEAMSEYYYDCGEFAQSISAATKAAHIFEQRQMNEDAATCYSVLCIAYHRIGNMGEALNYGRKNYEYDLQTGDDDRLSSSLNNLATLYLGNRQPEMAEKYILRAIEIEQQLDRPRKLATRFGIASEIYTALGQYEKAVEMGEKAYRLDIEGERELQAAKRLSQIAAAYEGWNKIDQAETYIRKAIGLLQKHNEQVSLTISYNLLGRVLRQKRAFHEAQTSLLKAAAMAEQTQNSIQLLKAYDELAELLESDLPREALNYKKKSYDLQRKIFREESERQMNNFSVQYETAEKELHIQKQQSEIERTKLHRMLFALSTVFALLLCGMLYLLLRQRRKRNRQLAEANATKDKLFSIISHDLKAPVIAQKTTLDTLIANYDAYETDNLLDYLERFRMASESQMGLLQNLLSWAQVQTGRAKYAPIPFDITRTIAETADLYGISSENKHIRITTEMPERCYVMGDREMIATVLRNLINNAVKFSHPDSEIHLSAVDRPASVRISVKDSGTGLTETQVEAIRGGVVSGGSSAGTQGERGSGLGLIICKDFLRRNGSSLVIESRNGEGTCMSFELNKVNC
ncbi:tetratricopeptide repeat-containing sensor histidine kinase [Tannerella sp.]|uniref:sensor histidine kinase n=1 Tax=Tannerella sp. TaxID=2382127 RepID=UPI0026DC9F8C|nr:tetratricopeptide repeat-containing sensor histidine kinase [Tannerella sp.]MDO4704349.1 tetratricopeptide repeat-containing sensor histidine kinase [Tannerella sp.]